MAKERKSSIARRARRKALALIGGALTAPWILSSAVRAQAAWPSRTVRYINPYPPGGPTDTLSRLFCAAMSDLTGQQFVVENRGGDGGDVGTAEVARGEPDGYLVGLGGIASHAIAPTLKAARCASMRPGISPS
jgi:tripartite-type tricarboxylate transporter receptor subunit TctC